MNELIRSLMLVYPTMTAGRVVELRSRLAKAAPGESIKVVLGGTTVRITRRGQDATTT